MNILDKIVLNRLVNIITTFIVNILKIFAPKSVENIDIDNPKPKRKKIFPWRKNDQNN
jgi:hypothetical protein